MEFKLRELALKMHSPLIIYNDKDDVTTKRLIDFILSLFTETKRNYLESSTDTFSLFLPLLHDTEEFLQNLFPEDHWLNSTETGTILLDKI